jgi:2-C-methyl-D-erythritol 2,4-cyclodiphosphate synthase
MYRIGFGNDIHRLEADRQLILGGVTIESDLGAVGHSDADCLTHAITDALLGALALGDIGQHFSDTDDRWRGSDSFVFLRHALAMVSEHGYEVVNVDSTISLEKPKLRPHIDDMRSRIAGALRLSPSAVSIKAKTGEKVDAVGRREAIRCDAVVLVQRKF